MDATSNGVTREDVVAEIVNEVAAADVDELTSYVLGAMHDGTFSRHHGTIRISQKDRRWLRVISTILTRLGSRSWTYQEGIRDVWVIESTYMPMPQSFRSQSALKGYIRGYFDAEGGLPKGSQARFYLQFCQKDQDDLKTVHSALQSLGFPVAGYTIRAFASTLNTGAFMSGARVSCFSTNSSARGIRVRGQDSLAR